MTQKITITSASTLGYGCLAAVAFLLAYSLAISLPVWWLWNSTMPGLTGVEHLSYWGAIKLVVLARIVFSGVEIKAKDRD